MSGEGGNGGDESNMTMKEIAFTLKAMQMQFAKIDRDLNNVRDEIETVRQPQQFHYTNTRRGRPWQQTQDETLGDESEEDILEHGRARREDRRDSNINSIKMQIPPFKGRNDVEAYLEWQRKVDLIFDCHNYSEEKKVKLAAVEFTGYALVWWDQVTLSRRRNGERPITTWTEMKTIMKKRFVPSYYYRELHQKLQRLTQGSLTVEDYHKEMEMAMIRANVEEDPEATMARFLSGLNRDIADVVELQHYVEMEDMLSMAMKVERQLRSKGTTKAYSGSTSDWNSKWSKKNDKGKEKSNDVKNMPRDKDAKSDFRGTTTTTPSSSNNKHSNIKCFR